MITVDRIKTKDPKNSALIVLVDAESLKDFKELVHRATNLWPDASAEIKEFSDQVCNADMLKEDQKGLQDYTEHRINQPKKD